MCSKGSNIISDCGTQLRRYTFLDFIFPNSISADIQILIVRFADFMVRMDSSL